MSAGAPDQCRLAIVGGGPAGLAAAIALARAGTGDVHVLEREHDAGGIPRHCGHPPFGLREYHRLLTGPRYAARLVAEARAAGVHLHTATTVTGLAEGGVLGVCDERGEGSLQAERVLLATGVRETPRSARLVSGSRPLGVVTTGALQSTVYLAQRRPFRRPVIVGSELVAFSALLTCRHAGIAPVAMIEAGERICAWRFSSALPRLLGVPVRLRSRVARIYGRDRVEGVQLVHADGGAETLDCDGVVFCGEFVPEASLPRLGHLALDAGSGGPRVDPFGRCSDPAYHATGNLLRAVETAGWCHAEGRRAAACLADSLDGHLPDPAATTSLRPVHPVLKYALPQRLVAGLPTTVQLRLARPARGQLLFRCGERIVHRQALSSRPERRVLVRLPGAAITGEGTIEIDFTDHREQ